MANSIPQDGYPHSGGFMYFPLQYRGENYMLVYPKMRADGVVLGCKFGFCGNVNEGFVPVESKELAKILDSYNKLQDPFYVEQILFPPEKGIYYSGNNFNKFLGSMSFDNFFKYLESTGNGRLCVFTNMKDKPYVNARFVNRVTGEVVIPQSGEYTNPGNFMGSHLTYEKDSNGKIVGSHSDWSFEYDYQLDKDGRIIADNTKPNKAGFEDLIYTKFVK